MVIVVTGEVESGGNYVGRLLAEFLGWEFTEVRSWDRVPRTRGPGINAERISGVDPLSSAIDSSVCEWRDVIISCPTLRDEDQRKLRYYHHQLVKFVHLKAPDGTNHSLLLDQPTVPTNSGVPARREAAPEEEERVLAVDASQEVEQILGAVLSTLILKRRSSHVHAA